MNRLKETKHEEGRKEGKNLTEDEVEKLSQRGEGLEKRRNR